MTPCDFQKRMTEICQGSDITMVALAGADLVDAALGLNAHAYLPAICDYFNRLSELRGQVRPSFSAPTTESIAAAQKEAGRVVL